ncbi:MAG: nuclear transport factor 2 family protein [Steroidobacteraceae bacterium]
MTLEEEVAALRSEVAALRAEARAATDYIAISNLQRGYGYYVDKGLYDQAAGLFAEDGTLEIAGRGVYVGRERIRQYLNHLPAFGRGQLFNHMQLQPVIHVDGAAGTARGRWRCFIQIATLGVEARWGEATYENDYVKRAGLWQIAKLHGYITYYSEYDRGWDKGGVKLVRSIQGLTPDRPPTEQYEAWPEVFIPPFHYVHPVTGGAGSRP